MEGSNPENTSSPGGSGQPQTSRKLVIIIVSVVVGLSFLGWLGSFIMGKVVGFGVRKAFEAGTGVKVDERGNTVTYTGPDGAKVTVSGDDGGSTLSFTDDDGQTGTIEAQTGDGAKTLPKDFPSGFPVPPGAVLTSTYSMSLAGEGRTFSLVWSTDQGPDDVVSFLEAAMAGQGWSKNVSSTFDDTTLVYFERPATDDDKDIAMFSVAPNDEGVTEISLTLTMPAR